VTPQEELQELHTRLEKIREIVYVAAQSDDPAAPALALMMIRDVL
jgi:hypothetical protein